MTTIASQLALAHGQRVDIPVIGDSVTEGQGASALTTRYIAQLNGLLRQRFPGAGAGTGGGLGFIPIYNTGENTFTWPVSHTSLSTTPLGPVRFCSQAGGTTSWSWTAPAGTTSVRVMYFDADPGSVAGTFSYQVGSGSVIQVSNAGAGDGTLTASIPISGGQVLTIAWVSGFTFLDGIVHYAGDESSGVTFHALGHSGWTAGTSSDGWAQGDAFDWRPSIAALASGGLGIFLGLNDAQTNVGDESASVFQSALTSFIGFLLGNTALASVPLFLIAAYEEGAALVEPWADYVAALQAVATATGAQLVDLGAGGMPSVADDPGIYADSVHPNDTGHALLASIVAAGLAPGESGTGSVAVPKPSLSGSGKYETTGHGSVRAPKPSMAASGQERWAGTGSVRVPKPSLSASGTAGSGDIPPELPTGALGGSVTGFGAGPRVDLGEAPGIPAVAGNDLLYDLAFTDAGNPLGLPGWTVRVWLKARSTAPDATGTEFTTASGLTVTGSAGGLVAWAIPGAATAGLGPGALWYRADLTSPGGDTATVLYGALALAAA